MKKNVNTPLDYCLAVFIIIEAGILYFALTRQISFIGYFLPTVVAIFAIYISVSALLSFKKLMNK
ncbi:MAG: hypothetical protein ACOWWO_14605 [Peptococcaceae bacterium]